MPDTQVINEKDLDLIDDKPAADDGGKGAGSGDGNQPSGDDKGKGEGKQDGRPEGGKGSSVFDDLGDDDDIDDKPKGKQDGKEKPAESDAGKSPEKGADGEEKPAAKDDKSGKDPKDGKEAGDDGDWRRRSVDKILEQVKDRLTQAKFEKRQEQLLKVLGRYKTIEDAIASGVLAQEKLRAGNKLDKEATPEEQAKWRKENDVPEAPDKYDIPAVPGHTWSDADQPTVDEFRGIAHELNLSQAQVNRLVQWHVQTNLKTAEDWDASQKAMDAEDREACMDTLRTEFGVREAKVNVKLSERLLKDDEVFGDEAAKAIMSARYIDANGQWRRLVNLPSVSRGLIGLSLDRYGDGPLPAEDGRVNSAKTELDEIDHIMKTDFDRYHREGLADKAMKLRQEEAEREQKRARRRA